MFQKISINCIITALLYLIFVLGCKSKAKRHELTGAWAMINKTTAGFEQLPLETPGEFIVITPDSLTHTEVMEDTKFQINHTTGTSKRMIYYPDKDEKNFYMLTWIDRQKGIASFEICIDAACVTRYFVDQSKLKYIKQTTNSVKTHTVASIPGDPIKDSMILGSSKKKLYIEADDCLSIRNQKGDQLYEHCFEGSILRIRSSDEEVVPLTIISGSRSVDIDFYPVGNDWLSKTVTYFAPQASAKQGITQPFEVSIKNFDFGAIITTFETGTDH